jgi:hypothetical protein
LLFSLAGFHTDVVLALTHLCRIVFRTRLLLIAALLAAVRWFRTCRTGDAGKTQHYEKHSRSHSHDRLLLMRHDAGLFGHQRATVTRWCSQVFYMPKTRTRKLPGMTLPRVWVPGGGGSRSDKGRNIFFVLRSSVMLRAPGAVLTVSSTR